MPRVGRCRARFVVPSGRRRRVGARSSGQSGYSVLIVDIGAPSSAIERHARGATRLALRAVGPGASVGEDGTGASVHGLRDGWIIVFL